MSGSGSWGVLSRLWDGKRSRLELENGFRRRIEWFLDSRSGYHFQNHLSGSIVFYKTFRKFKIVCWTIFRFWPMFIELKNSSRDGYYQGFYPTPFLFRVYEDDFRKSNEYGHFHRWSVITENLFVSFSGNNDDIDRCYEFASIPHDSECEEEMLFDFLASLST